MNRVRWLYAEWPVSMRNLGGKLKNNAFTVDSLDGFIVEKIRDDFIEGRFVQKLVYNEVVSDPFGSGETVERTVYQSTEFSLFSTFPYIELRNGQRSIKDFVNRLLQACDFDLVIAPTAPGLLDWVQAFQSEVASKLVVDSLQLSGVELERGISGKILIKGERDVRGAVRSVVGGKPHTLEKLQIKLTKNGRTVCIHLGNNGTARFPADVEDEVRPLLRRAFPPRKN